MSLLSYSVNGWGNEDMEFAYRAVVVHHYRIRCIKAYVNHVYHTYEERNYTRNLEYFRKKHNIKLSTYPELNPGVSEKIQ